MPVPEEMRLVETEIDQLINSSGIWKYSRNILQRGIIDYYRDQIERLQRRTIVGRSIRHAGIIEQSLNDERDLRAGILWFLIWVMERSEDCPRSPRPSASKIAKFVKLGSKYEILVDILKMANHDLVSITVNTKKRMVTVFEGGDRTGADSQMFYHQARSLPFEHHRPLVDDDDLLTVSGRQARFGQ
jgi:hypothetical protein